MCCNYCCCCEYEEQEERTIYHMPYEDQRDYGDECDNIDWIIRDGLASAMESIKEMIALLEEISRLSGSTENTPTS